MLKHWNILLVEDEALVALDLMMTLEDEGARITGPFATVEAALPACGSVDMAVLDVDLCGAQVFPVADRLAETGTPFMFHTGRADLDVLMERYGRDVRIVRKPSRGDEIVRGLSGMLAVH